MDKTKLLADISLMPKGYSGTIKVVNPVSRIIGDTAILSHDCDETETVFGQHLTARYHGNDMWLRRNSIWQIVTSQAMRYYEDPAIGRAIRRTTRNSLVSTNWPRDKREKSSSKARASSSSARASARTALPRVSRHLFPEKRGRPHPISPRERRQDRRLDRSPEQRRHCLEKESVVGTAGWHPARMSLVVCGTDARSPTISRRENSRANYFFLIFTFFGGKKSSRIFQTASMSSFSPLKMIWRLFLSFRPLR